MKKLFLFAMLMASPLIGQATNISFSPVGSTITYTAGTVTVQGVAQSVNSGTLSSFTANLTNCSQAAIISGTDSCGYIYYVGSGTSLSYSNVFATGFPYILATFTTDGSGNPLAVSVYNLPPITSLYQGASTGGAIASTQAVASASTMVLNPNVYQIFAVLLGGNVTSVTLVTPPVGTWICLSAVQPSSGGPYTFTWPSNMHWPAGTTALGLSTTGGSALTIATGANNVSGARCYYAGSVAGWYCMDTWWGLH